MGERRSLQSRAPACAFCVFVIAFAGARGRVAARRIGLCLGFLAAVAAASRWVSTLFLLSLLCVVFDFVQVPHLDLAILNQSHVTSWRRGIKLEALPGGSTRAA